MTNRLINNPTAALRKKLSAQEQCDLWNKQLRGMEPSNDKQAFRDDVAWFVGKDGKPHLEYLETDFDQTMKRIKDGLVSQQAIDRLPFNIRRIAWNRGYLNCDYGDPPRYWLPRQTIEEVPQERTGLEWFNE